MTNNLFGNSDTTDAFADALLKKKKQDGNDIKNEEEYNEESFIEKRIDAAKEKLSIKPKQNGVNKTYYIDKVAYQKLVKYCKKTGQSQSKVVSEILALGLDLLYNDSDK